MDELETRLTRCFLAAFPGLAEGDARQASTATIAGWDSLAQVTLLSLVAEEFGVALDFEEFQELTSFAAVLARLRAAGAS